MENLYFERIDQICNNLKGNVLSMLDEQLGPCPELVVGIKGELNALKDLMFQGLEAKARRDFKKGERG